MNDAELPVLAIDIGGTKILAALISGDGEVLARDYCLTLADEGVAVVTSRIFNAVDRLLTRQNLSLSGLHSISIAAAGIIDSNQGVITFSPNLPGWRDIPLRGLVKERCGVATFLVNDASAAALGEHHFGVGKGVDNLIYITVSTGIGGGIVAGGRLYLGASGSAGEIGHMVIEDGGPVCRCGRNGCLEALASGTAMVREAVQRIQEGEPSILGDMVGGDLAEITAEQISAAAECGDELAREVIAQAAYYLGVGLANLVNIFNPELIVVGGGVAKMGDRLLGPARMVMEGRAFRLPAGAVRVIPAGMGDDVSILGAAVYALTPETL